MREAAARGLSALAITDHDGMYGVPQFAQAAARLQGSGIRLGTVFGAELSLDLARRAAGRCSWSPSGRAAFDGTGRPAGTARAGVPDPAGRHLLILARDPEGYRRLCQVDQHRSAGRRREGPAALRRGRARGRA